MARLSLSGPRPVHWAVTRPESLTVVRWMALGAIVVPALLRAMVTEDPLPRWDLNPAISESIITGLTPAGSVLIDVVILLGCAVLMLAEAASDRPLRRSWLVLFVLGAIPAVIHSGVLSGEGLHVENLRLGMAWLSALASAIALAHACRDRNIARPLAAALVAFVIILAARAAVQVLIEHPQTVQDYQNNRDAFLAARGWTPDSPMAQSFERRLKQPDATAWFGLSNVYASFVAASLAALLALAPLAWLTARRDQRAVPDGLAGIVALGLVASLVALWWASSKGGAAAAILGAGLVAVAFMLARKQQHARRLASRAWGVAAFVIAAPIIAILLRGALGERLSELSLLFRSFYIETATRVFLDSPLLGVGPAGFSQAYTLAKPPLSPEEVSSPHSLIFDYAARLGIGGLAWAALVVLLTALAARCLFPASASDPARLSPPPRAGLLILTLCATPVILSTLVSLPLFAASPYDVVIVRIVGLGFWFGLAYAIFRVARAAPLWPIALGGAALTLVAHAQYEVTATWASSAGLLAAFLGVSAGVGADRSSGAHPSERDDDAPAPPQLAGRPRWPSIAYATVFLTLAFTGLATLLPVQRWEASLTRAADHLAPLARARTLDPSGAARLFESYLGEPVPNAPGALETAFLRVSLVLGERAAEELEQGALRTIPRHREARQALSRLWLEHAQASIGLGRDPSRSLEAAQHHARLAVEHDPGSSEAWGWLGTVYAARAQMTGDPQSLPLALDAWTSAASLDPHGPTFPTRIAFLADDLGRPDLARDWAARALQADRNRRLDPLLQLREDQRARLRTLAERP